MMKSIDSFTALTIFYCCVVNTCIVLRSIALDYVKVGRSPASIAINDISLKLDPLAYISAAESIGVSAAEM